MGGHIIGFIMSGGNGARLWPLSRRDRPKQFHNLLGKGSSFSRTLQRLRMREKGEITTLILAAQEHAGWLGEEINKAEKPWPKIIFEPTPKNTANAIAIAAAHTLSEWGDKLVLAVPADHEISTDRQFWNNIEQGIEAALEGYLVTLGIKATYPEPEYGYIRTGCSYKNVLLVESFIEKPDLKDAEFLISSAASYWNTGIFLFRASTLEHAFSQFQPEIWENAQRAINSRAKGGLGFWIPPETYNGIPFLSFDKAIVEHMKNIAMVPACFSWEDIGSWRSLRDIGPSDQQGNVIVGNVVAMDCENTYLRSEGKLLSVTGMKNVAVVSTPDAMLVAPVNDARKTKDMVLHLQEKKRKEVILTQNGAKNTIELYPGFWAERVENWLIREAFPAWAKSGVDWKNGGFYEAINFDLSPVMKPKRIRTLARQIYSFSVAAILRWEGASLEIVEQGIAFLKEKGRSRNGGWVCTLNVDGSLLDETEDFYDNACVLMALGAAYMAGNREAADLSQQTLQFIDEKLAAHETGGFYDVSFGFKQNTRSQNAHMHFLEACLLWYDATGQKMYLERASGIIDLFIYHFFDSENWTLHEFFEKDWKKSAENKNSWIEPGHHFEWVWLLLNFMEKIKDRDLSRYAEKLYAFATGNGLNRLTGLAWGAVSYRGVPLVMTSRSWSQTESIKALIALNRSGSSHLGSAIECEVEKLFCFHINPAPSGLWMDLVDREGHSLSTEAPASILYHLVSMMKNYLDENMNMKFKSHHDKEEGFYRPSKRAINISHFDINGFQL